VIEGLRRSYIAIPGRKRRITFKASTEGSILSSNKDSYTGCYILTAILVVIGFLNNTVTSWLFYG